MENLTYEIYLANPAVREQLDREVRRARAEEMRRCIVALIGMFRRARPISTQVLAQHPELRSA